MDNLHKSAMEIAINSNTTLAKAYIDLRKTNSELVAALQALLDGRPTEEPPAIAKIAHLNWELFEQARAALTKAGAT